MCKCNIKYFLFYVLVLKLCCGTVFASEEVFLQVDKFTTLQAPNTLDVILDHEREYKEARINSAKDDYFNAEDDVFESNAGRAFGKFVDKVLINNKLNQQYAELENKYLED